MMERDVPLPDVTAATLTRKKDADTGIEIAIFDDDSIFLIDGLCFTSPVSYTLYSLSWYQFVSSSEHSSFSKHPDDSPFVNDTSN